jgi:hypothetical protein
MSVTCADASRAANEELAGTGVEATRWLLVESRQPWGPDAVETGFPPEVAERLALIDAKVFAIRRPGRVGARLTVLAAETGEEESTLRRLELRSFDELADADPWADGELLPWTVFLVCTHGRRDPCCSRLGIPIYHGFDSVAGEDHVWQCSHTGGHRFAPNVIALPAGLTYGRVERAEVPEIVGLLSDGRVLLSRYRGRSIYPAPAQAAEVVLRRARGLDRLDDLRLVGSEGEAWTFAVADGGSVAVRVIEEEGPLLPKSCGAEPEPTTTYRVEL